MVDIRVVWRFVYRQLASLDHYIHEHMKNLGYMLLENMIIVHFG